jgi:hypothetical protein
LSCFFIKPNKAIINLIHAFSVTTARVFITNYIRVMKFDFANRLCCAITAKSLTDKGLSAGLSAFVRDSGSRDTANRA